MRGFSRAWTPYDLGPGCLSAWWSADDHGTARMTDDGSGLISSWSDRVTGLAVTGTTTARPTWTSTALNSAKAGLTFDGTANTLETTTLTALPTGAVAGEIWAVLSQARSGGVSGNYSAVRYGGATDGPGAASWRWRGLGRVNAAGNANRARVAVDGTDAANILDDAAQEFGGAAGHVLRGQFSGTTLTGEMDGTTFSTSPASGVTTLATGTTRLRLGASTSGTAGNFWQGVLRHVIILRGLLPTKEEGLMRLWAAGEV